MAEAALIVTSKGYAKVVDEKEFPTKGRGGKGVAGFNVTEASGPVACAEHVQTGAGERVLVLTANGRALMTNVDDIKMRSRTAGGVKLMNVDDDDKVVAVLV